MKLKVSEILSAVEALRVLDSGQSKLIKDGGEDKLVSVPFTFTDSMRWWRAMTFSNLNKVVSAYDKARQSLVTELAKGEMEVPKEKRVEFNNRLTAMLDETEEVSVSMIRRSDFALQTNDIPGEVLAALFPS